MFLDIHTHNKSAGKHRAIQNIYRDFDRLSEPGFYSVGFHPAFITDNYMRTWPEFLKTVNLSCVVAIGECGLDKICGSDFRLQLEVFRKQMLIANEIEKPLIVHCVRAWQPVIELLNSLPNKVPVVFHGFNNNIRIAKKLIASGFYLSFGKSVFYQRMHDVIRNVPVNKIFLETDNSDFAIEHVYEMAAQIVQLDMATLCSNIQHNALKVFGNKFLYAYE